MSSDREAVLLAIAVLQRRQVDPLLDEIAWGILGINPFRECTCKGTGINCLRHYGN